MSTKAGQVQVTGITLEGDWARLPVASRLRLEVTSENKSSSTGNARTVRGYGCTVVREIRASTLYAVLEGAARPLSCEDPADKYKRVSRYWFLADYGFFFREGDSPNSFYHSMERIIGAKE